MRVARTRMEPLFETKNEFRDGNGHAVRSRSSNAVRDA